MISVEHRWNHNDNGWVLQIEALSDDGVKNRYYSRIHDSKIECMDEFTETWVYRWPNYDEVRVAVLNHIKEKL